MNFRTFFFVFLVTVLFASLASADVEILNVYLNDQILKFNYSDWQIMPGLLTVTLKNNDSQEAVFSLIVKIDKAGSEIYSSESYPYTFSPGQERTLDNVDLLAYYRRIDFDDNADTEIMELGYIGAGNYCFTFQINNGIKISDPAWCLTVTNPPNPSLISPGSSDYSNPIEIPTDFPLFQWSTVSDHPAVYYEFTLTELMEGQTPDGAIQNEPVLFASSQADRNLFLPAVGAPSALQYAGPQNLLDEYTYCWQIVANIPSSSGFEPLFSEIWTFKINQNSEVPLPEVEIVLNVLEQAGVPGDVIELLEGGQIGTVTLNGQTISIDQMMQELSGGINILSAGVSE